MMPRHKQETLTYPRLAAIVASRIVLNAIFRLGYPLVPFVAGHLGVTITAATWIVTIQVLTGLASPLGGWLGDRYGHRHLMMLGLGLVTVGSGSVVFASTLPLLVAALAISGIGTAMFNPSMQAYVSNLTPFSRRGRALGLVELSWSLAGIFAVPPLVALAEATTGIARPFGLLSMLMLGMMVLNHIVLPQETHATGDRRPAPAPLRLVVTQPSFVALFGFLWLVLFGQETLFIAQAPWLTQRFGATPHDIATALFAFGIGELVGVLLSTLFTDRLGKRRAPLLGFTGTAVIYLLLTLFATSWPRYLLLFALYGLCFEFAIVSSFSLSSAINPAARGTLMAAAATATQTGRAAGSWFGIRLFQAANLVGNGFTAVIVTAIGILIGVLGVHPQEQDHKTMQSEPVTIL